MLKIGDVAPQFVLPDALMEWVQLDSFLGKKHVVIYFFQRVATPGATVMADEYSDRELDFEQRDAVVLGISREDSLKLEAFQEHHGSSLPLLSDQDGAVSQRYGVMAADVSGKAVVSRSTFVIDKKGIVRQVWVGAEPKGHALQVLKMIQTLQ